MRILIAEDDQVLADGLLRSLRSAGYAVDQVSNGCPRGHAALADHEFDCVILDLGLPRIDGLEVLKMRGRGGTVPVLILTAADAGTTVSRGSTSAPTTT